MPAKYFRTPGEFRRWLERHHGTATEVVLGFYKTSARVRGMSYRDALDQALCFGWIDGVRHRVDDERYTNRFSPRRPRSYWSQVNIARFEELRRDGLAAAPGEAAFARRDQKARARYSNERGDTPLAAKFQRALESNRAAWAYFSSQAPSYQRVARHWVMSAVQPSTRERRFAELLADSAAGRRLRATLPSKPRAK